MDAVPELPPETTVGAVELTVSDLARSRHFYEAAIGLRALDEGDGRLVLGAGAEPLLALVEEPGSRPSVGHTGLFHFALLLPDRPSLARWLAHAARDRVPLTGLSDHFVSEALYLDDPDRHGIELYADRPREVWEGQVFERMTSEPLDVDGLLAELGDSAQEPFDGLHDGTRMGHVHLRVADVADTVAFYRGVLGFELMAQLGPHAAFLAAGGYHHHVGANVWESSGAGPAPAGTASLRHATVVFPEATARDAAAARVADAGGEIEARSDGIVVRDPAGNALLLAA
jgi:catechol 2,3-dioxygenase